MKLGLLIIILGVIVGPNIDFIINFFFPGWIDFVMKHDRYWP